MVVAASSSGAVSLCELDKVDKILKNLTEEILQQKLNSFRPSARRMKLVRYVPGNTHI